MGTDTQTIRWLDCNVGAMKENKRVRWGRLSRVGQSGVLSGSQRIWSFVSNHWGPTEDSWAGLCPRQTHLVMGFRMDSTSEIGVRESELVLKVCQQRILSQCIRVANRCVKHFKYFTVLFVSYTLINLEKKNVCWREVQWVKRHWLSAGGQRWERNWFQTC